MLINQENIQQRFNENLEWATEIDLATAWATIHDGLQALQSHTPPLKVRAVVGLWGNATDPEALTKLAKIGELRLVDKSGFHPKVYVFRGQAKAVAWIGSANFTNSGFGMNQEALFETRNIQDVEKWFDNLWEQCGSLDEYAIGRYAESRLNNPPQHSTRPTRVAESDPLQTPLELLKQVDDWRSFVEALEQCDRWWSNRQWWTVFGDPPSWRETIQVLHHIVREDWHELSSYNRKRLLGLTTREDDWALLGRMRGPAQKSVFGDNSEKIQAVVRDVVAADNSEFPNVAIRAYERLWSLKGIGQGIASRLLTLARPDRFVSLNNASETRLGNFFDLTPATLGQPKNYERLLQRIYDQTWFREPYPRNAREETICRMRAALLDCFVYDDQLPG